MKYEGAQIHWNEGMFMQSHHFQTADRSQTFRECQQAVLNPYWWGISGLDIDNEALQGFRFRINRAALRLKNGLWLTIPGNAEAQEQPFQEEFHAADRSVPVWIGVKRSYPHQPLTHPIGEEGMGTARPYMVRQVDIEDENIGANERSIQVRIWNTRIFFKPPGEEYEAIKIGEINRSDGPGFNKAFIPAVVNIGASRLLKEKLNNIVAELKNQAASLQESAKTRDFTSTDNPVELVSRFLNLQIASSYGQVLAKLQKIDETHPFHIYLEMARLAGALTVISPLVPLNVPEYEHDNLTDNMEILITTIRNMLRGGVAPEYVERPFVVQADRTESRICPIEREWLESECAMYLGIDTEKTEIAVSKILNDRRVKIGPPSVIQVLLHERRPGIPHGRPLAKIPMGLRHQGGRYYYQLDITRRSEFFQDLLSDLCMEIRGIPPDEIRDIKLYVHLKKEKSSG